MMAAQDGIRAEDIYDALLDDEALSMLPQRLASAFGARSSLIHWVFADGTADVVAHSGYFSDDQLGTYATHFASQDPWIEASARANAANVAMNLEDLVPVDVFTRTPFYNDYVRAMGDDTCRCMGLRIENAQGSGFVALQRGLTQPSFEPDMVAALQGSAPHLGKMLSFRGRLAVLERQQASSAAMLDALGEAAFLVTAAGRLIHLNAAGAELLKGSGALFHSEGMLCARDPSANQRLRAAMAKAGAPSGAQATALSLPSASGGQIAVSLAPLCLDTGRQVLILARDPERKDASLETRLRDLYRLSATEAHLAVMLADGANPASIAQERGVALDTVRAQIKSITAKLDCSRQAEIVRVVKTLPPLR